jgi:hypothetical protein
MAVIAAAVVLGLAGAWFVLGRGKEEPVAVAPTIATQDEPSPGQVGTAPPIPPAEPPAPAPPPKPVAADAPPSPPPPTPEPTQASPTPPPAPAADTVSVHLLLKPEHARVVLDGLATRANPLVLPKDNLSHKLVIAAPGYYTETREFRAQMDGEVAVTLRPEKSRTASRPQTGAGKKVEGPVETEW